MTDRRHAWKVTIVFIAEDDCNCSPKFYKDKTSREDVVILP